MYKECNIQINEALLTQLLGKIHENALYINEDFVGHIKLIPIVLASIFKI